MKKTYDFGFGDTRGLREMTIKKFFNFPLESSLVDWNLNGGYAPHEGNPELVSETNKLIYDLTGLKYKHVLITAGATNALNAYLYAKRKVSDQEFDYVYTNNLYYRMYPQIIKNQNMFHISDSKDYESCDEDIHIIDSPTNPKGEIITGLSRTSENTVWDSAYHSPTYYGVWNGTRLSIPKVFPSHEAMVGSFSKLTSINGIRVGWMATDNAEIYDLAFKYVQGDSCSVNSVGQALLVKFLQNVDMNEFYKSGNGLLSDNKQELSKLCYLLGRDFIPENGMFAFSEVDKKLIDLFGRAGVSFTDGRSLGANYDSVRINLANTKEETKEMVQTILKTDGK